MKTRSALFLLLPLLFAAGSARAQPAPAAAEPTPPAAGAGTATDRKGAPTPPPLSPRFQQVRDRIAALFGHRGESQPRTEPRFNPFRPAGVAPAAPAAPAAARGTSVAEAGPAPPPAPAAVDLELLRLGAAALKVAGTVKIGGRDHLIINQAPYKEGDVINVRVKGQPVFLRVKNISRYSYTLSLNDAEYSVRY